MKSRILIAMSAALALAMAPSIAQPMKEPVQGPEAPETPGSLELDKTGKTAHIDFGLNLEAISDTGMKFSQFANRKLMIFYFSAKCPHCQHAIPYVQKLSDELAAKGFVAVAIAVKFNSGDDIREFIRDYKVHIPVFHDEEQTFGTNYGTGSVPVVYLVDAKGEYIRHKSFDGEKTPGTIKIESERMAGK
jgi:thiol-disulfide isomerase/thioredoxin